MTDYTDFPAVVLQDQFGRIKRKLRISVTDRCNFKCQYCMPEHPTWVPKHELLSFEALLLFCRIMVKQGIEHIRITGGEPLMRQGVVHFIADLNALRAVGLKRISMTTNGHYLARYAAQLKQAGLDDLNISLDSIDAEQFAALTKKSIEPVLAGIAAAQAQDFAIKINCVLLRGQNDNQILPLLDWCIQQQLQLRFIEFMPLDGDANWQRSQVVTEADILAVVATQYAVHELQQGSEPARSYHLKKSDMIDHNIETKLGIISTISHSFCGDCDRIRLSAQGELLNCLFATNGLKLKPLLTQILQAKNADLHLLKQHTQNQIQHYIWQKAAGYTALRATRATNNTRKISMHLLGG